MNDKYAMEIEIDVEIVNSLSPMQEKAIKEVESSTPDFGGIDFYVFGDLFHIGKIINAKNREAWTKWFFNIYTSKNMSFLNQVEYVNKLYFENGNQHILYLCTNVNNWYFFAALIKYIHFMEEMKNNNLKTDYKTIHFSTAHSIFDNHSFENYLFSYYNTNELKFSFIDIMNRTYNNIISSENLTFV